MVVRRVVSHVQLSNQRQLIVKGFGFNSLQTTLLGCVDGVVESEYSTILCAPDDRGADR